MSPSCLQQPAAAFLTQHAMGRRGIVGLASGLERRWEWWANTWFLLVFVHSMCLYIIYTYIVMDARNINRSLQIMRLSFVHAFKPPSTSKHHVLAWDIASIHEGPIKSSSFTSHRSIVISRNKQKNSTNSFLSQKKNASKSIESNGASDTNECIWGNLHNWACFGDFEIFEISQQVWSTLSHIRCFAKMNRGYLPKINDFFWQPGVREICIQMSWYKFILLNATTWYRVPCRFFQAKPWRPCS